MSGIVRHLTPGRAAGAVLALATVALIWAVVHDLSKAIQQRSGTNYVDVAHFVVDLAPGQTLCQHETIPKDTGGIRMLPTSYHQPTPAMRLFVRSQQGRLVSSARIKAGWVEGMNDFQLPPIRETTLGYVCLRNLGPKVHLTIAGENVPQDVALTVDGQPTTSEIFLQYLRPGTESYFSIAPLVLSRMRQGKAGWFGPWIPILIVALVLGCVVGTLALARREVV